jgi:hypothetical protein
MQSQVERGGVCVGGDGSCGAEYGEVETRTRTGRQRRRRDAWTVHSKPRTRGHEGVNPESKGPVWGRWRWKAYDAGRLDGECGGMVLLAEHKR